MSMSAQAAVWVGWKLSKPVASVTSAKVPPWLRTSELGCWPSIPIQAPSQNQKIEIAIVVEIGVDQLQTTGEAREAN